MGIEELFWKYNAVSILFTVCRGSFEFFLYQSRKLSFEFDTHNSGIPLAKLFHFGTVKIKGLHHDSGRKINPLHKYRFTVKHV